MFKHPPFSGNQPVLQAFGENPDLFRQFVVDGVEQRGHNGIDFQLPHGSALWAVESARVLEARNDSDGYGNYIVLGHQWGQTLYAHLSHFLVEEGDFVTSGQEIGRSGDSGATSTPHLHFGLRIHPFSLRDGWFGFSDPQPYLDRMTEPLGPVIGPHIVGGLDLELLAQWQPRMTLVLDPNPDEMRRLRATCPNTVIVGRVFATDHEIAENIREDPFDAARWAHSKTMERMNPHVDYWQFANEILQSKDELSLLNRFELERMALAEAAGYKCAILAFSVGNPDLPEDKRMACWEEVYPAIERAETNGHVIALHQYGMPDLLGPEGLTDWLILRLEHQVLMRLPYKKVKFAVTEYGIDGLIQGPSPSGWKHFTNAEDYAAQLLRLGRYTERFSGRILGYAVFTLGHHSPWGSYDIGGAVSQILAERSERGVWSDLTDASVTLGETLGDQSSTPGVGTGVLQPGIDIDEEPEIGGEDPGKDDDSSTTEPTPPTDGEDTNTGPTVPDGDSTDEAPTGLPVPAIEQRIAPGFQAMNAQIRPIADRPDVDVSTLEEGDTVYLIKDVFTTRNGSWERTDDTFSIVQWARDSYLKPFGADDWFDDAGADHHIFGAVLGTDGELIRNHEMIFWSDGFQQLNHAEYEGFVRVGTKAGSGWANQPLGPGSSYVPERGERGPWCWMPAGVAEVYEGGGLPANHHISTFVVWQAVLLEKDVQGEDEQDKGGGQDGDQSSEPGNGKNGEQTTPTPDGGTTSPTPPTEEPDEVKKPVVEQRFGDWIDDFNMRVISFADRVDADAELANADVVYVLKDLFTTRDGSWEPSDKPGSIQTWAREYLKPFGAPDYFDDAGGDRHLFAAVIGLDGELLKHKQIIYWSDGIAKLGDPAYDGFVYRETKDKSGWINIPIGPGSNFVPERGESGPWCWAPSGAADVVCGGGLPAKQHVSTFAVWQAVKKSDLIATEPDEGQPDEKEEQKEGKTTIFMPFVAGARSGQPARESAEQIAPEEERADGDFSAASATAIMEADRSSIRANAWIRTGVEFREDSPFVLYARKHELGMPATDEFEFEEFLVQGYSGAILYAPKDEPTSIEQMAW